MPPMPVIPILLRLVLVPATLAVLSQCLVDEQSGTGVFMMLWTGWVVLLNVAIEGAVAAQSGRDE